MIKQWMGVIYAGLAALILGGPCVASSTLVNHPEVENWTVWGDGQKHHYVKAAVAGGSALRVEIAGPRPNAWDIGAHADITDDVHAGDTVTAAFWARVSGEHTNLTATIQANEAPYTLIGRADIALGPGWTLHFVTGKAAAPFAARHSGVALQLGGARAVVEIGPVFIVLNDPGTRAAMRQSIARFRFDTRVEDVVIHTGTVDLAATFRAPAGKGPFPAALMVTGHGPQSRGSFRLMSDTLVRHGIATLEFDKRGCGESTGTFATASLADLIADAAAAGTYLKSRSDVAGAGLIGASEGAIVVPAVMAKDPAYAFAVLIGVAARHTEDMALDQWESANRVQGVSEDKIVKGRAVVTALYDAVRATTTDAEALQGAKAVLAPVVAERALTPEQADQMASELASKPMREFLAFDPVANLGRIKKPVLALTGSLDLQVPAAKNFPALRRALADNPDVTAMELPGLNHNLQKAKTGMTDEWARLGMPFSDQPALDLIAHWIDRHVARRAD